MTPKTKEKMTKMDKVLKIINECKHVLHYDGEPEALSGKISKVMDEYSEAVAISFAEWIRKNDVSHRPFENEQWFHPPTKEWYSDQGIFQLYKQSI